MNTSNRVNQLKNSAIHEMTRLSKQYDDVAFLSWAKPTTGTPEHINDAVVEAIHHERGLFFTLKVPLQTNQVGR